MSSIGAIPDFPKEDPKIGKKASTPVGHKATDAALLAFKPTQSNEGAKAVETKPSSSKALDQRAANNAKHIQEITDRKIQAEEVMKKTSIPERQVGENLAWGEASAQESW